MTEGSIYYIICMNKSHRCLIILKIFVVLIAMHVCLGKAVAQKKFLFDATKAETAGNADWVIDEDSNIPGRFPTPQSRR